MSSTNASTSSTPSFTFSSTPAASLTFGNAANISQPSTTSITTPIFSSTLPTTVSNAVGITAPPSSLSSGFGSVAKTPAVGFSLPSTSQATTETNKNAASLVTSTATTASIAASAASTQLNFCQLEELINKWTLELEEQEKMFLNQATQVNSWDKVLINNSNKIVSLSEAVEKVKIEQQALEQELEFIAAQHTELDECITPLQNELSKMPHIDVEKAQTYILAESLDTQLRQMSEDLKEVIEHLNEANKMQDADDPIVQIGKILNAHMSSLQWIESSASQVTTKIEDISKMYDSMRRDNERSIFRLTYNE